MTPYYSQSGVTIYHGDCRDILPSLAADVVVTDPPFNVGKDYGVHRDAMSDEAYNELLAVVARACPIQGWVTPTVHLARFAGILGADAHPVIVRRGAQGPIRFGWSDQFLLLLVRGKPAKAVSNLWDDIRLPDEGYFYDGESYGHPGTTAQGVMARLVGLLTAAGATVVDPFLGTGTTLRVAKNYGLSAIGIEIDERWCEVSAKRLQQEALPLETPA